MTEAENIKYQFDCPDNILSNSTNIVSALWPSSYSDISYVKTSPYSFSIGLVLHISAYIAMCVIIAQMHLDWVCAILVAYLFLYLIVVLCIMGSDGCFHNEVCIRYIVSRCTNWNVNHPVFAFIHGLFYSISTALLIAYLTTLCTIWLTVFLLYGFTFIVPFGIYYGCRGLCCIMPKYLWNECCYTSCNVPLEATHGSSSIRRRKQQYARDRNQIERRHIAVSLPPKYVETVFTPATPSQEPPAYSQPANPAVSINLSDTDITEAAVTPSSDV